MRILAERWDAPVIITTSVRFFESLFADQPTDCRKLHHIANSVVLFDESQSLPSDLAPATIKAVNALCKKYQCSMVFSTATQPDFAALHKTDSEVAWKPMEMINAVCTGFTRRPGCISAVYLEIAVMMLVVAYDVDTTTQAGEKRLRKVAQLCERYGSRVQNSVFEVLLTPAQLVELKSGLTKIIDVKSDSIRIYRIGSTYQNKIEVLGKSTRVEIGEPILI